MQPCQTARRNDDHHTFHDHKQRFVARKQRPVEPTRQFNAAIDGTREDRDRCHHETDEEGLEESGGSEIHVSRVAVAPRLPHSQCEFTSCDPEQDQGEDLETKTCQHDVFPEIRTGDSVSGRSDTTAESLEHQGDEVASAEDDCVGAGLEAGEVFAVYDDNTGQAEVDRCCEQSGCDCERHKIHEEIVIVERGAVEHNSGYVSH